MTANSPKLGLWTTTLAYLELLISILFSLLGLGLTNANYLRSTTIEAKTKSQISQVNSVCVKERKNLLRLLSWRMMAESVLFITHSSSLPMPSGSTPRHRCLGSMFLFTSGMTAAPYTAAAHSTCPDKTQTLYLNTHTRAQTTAEVWRQGPSIMFTPFSAVFGWSSYYIRHPHVEREWTFEWNWDSWRSRKGNRVTQISVNPLTLVKTPPHWPLTLKSHA